MKKLFTLLMVVLSVLLWNCSGNEDKDIDNPDKGGNEKPENVTLDLSVTDLTFEATGGTKEFIVRSNTDWAITNTSSWCQISTDKGRTDEAVTVSVSAYTGMEDRNTNLTVKSGNVTKILSVTQKRKDAIVLSKDKFDVPQAGGNIDIEVKSNIQYEVTIPEEYKDWIKEAVKSKAVETKNFSFTISANEDYSKRDGFIVIEGNAVKDTVRIYQAQIDKLILTKDQCNISSSEQNVEVELRTNVDFEVTIPDSVSGWINLIQTRAIRTDKVNLSIEENEGYDSRNAVIIFKDKNSELSDTLRIKQAQKNAIILGQKKYDLPQVGGNIVVEVQSNIQYQVTIPTKFQSWLKQSIKSKALETKDFSFIISANEEVEPREGYIIFDGNSIKDTIKIYQAQNNKIILSKNIYELSFKEQNIEIELNTNVEYEIIIPDTVSDWLNRIETRALKTDRINFHIKANKLENARYAVVIFQDKESNISDTLKIHQAPKEILTIDPHVIQLTFHGQSISPIQIAVKNNIPYDVIISDCGSAWLTSTDLNVSDRYSFYCSFNDKSDDRNAIIIFKSRFSDLADTLTVHQSGKPTLVVEQKHYEEKSSEGDIEVKVKINFPYEDIHIKEIPDWIKRIETKTFQDNILRFHIEENIGVLRKGEILLSDLTGYSIDTVYVTQLANTHVYKGDITFSSESEIEEFVKNGYTRINGNVEIKNTVTSLSAFNNTLKSISGNLQCWHIINYDGLGGLTDIGGNFGGTGPFVGLNKLTNIGGNFSVYESCKGLESLVSVEGDFMGHNVTSFQGLKKLSRIGGTFTPVGGTDQFSLASFEGLESLEYIGKNFWAGAAQNPELTTFKGLEKLKYIGGELGVMIAKLESFEGLNNLEVVGKITIHPSDRGILLTTKGLDNLSTVKGDFAVTDNNPYTSGIVTFDGLKHLGIIGGDLKIINNVDIKTLEGFNYLKMIGGSLFITGCDKLEDITAFPVLYEIGGDLIISKCNKLKSITTFSMLKNIGGKFEIYNNDSLISIGGYSNLQTVKNSVSIQFCRMLYDFSPLKILMENFNGKVDIYGNGYDPTKEQILNGQGKPQ